MTNRRSAKKSPRDAIEGGEQTTGTWPEGGSAENPVSVSSPPHYDDARHGTLGVAKLSMDEVTPSAIAPRDAIHASKGNTRTRLIAETKKEEREKMIHNPTKPTWLYDLLLHIT